MFLYSMLNDKHSELTKYAGNLAQLAIHLEELQENIQKTVDQSDNILDRVQESSEPAKAPKPALPASEPEPEPNPVEAPKEPEDEQMNHNQRILNMYRDGKTAVDIAKELGLGVGEVKLVIGLFREEEL